MAVTDRLGGASGAPFASCNLATDVGDSDSAVAANRGIVARALGFDGAAVVYVDCMSDFDGVIGVERDAGVTAGMVTTRPHQPIAVLSADSLPVIAVDHVRGVVGAVTVECASDVLVIDTLVSAMCDLGATPHGVTARTGPALCGRCSGDDGDVRPAVVKRLIELGVTWTWDDERCTFENENFYSIRAEGRTGRFASITWTRSA
jgi:copper oxidase (laccase) domain-containing protein